MKRPVKDVLTKCAKKFQEFISAKTIRIESVSECFPDAESIPHPIEKTTIGTPEAESMPFINSALHFKQCEHSTSQFKSYILSDAYYAPAAGVLLNESKTIIADSINTVRNAKRYKWSSLHLSKEKSIDGVSTVFKSVSNEFYHVLIDNVPRLYALHHAPFSSYEKIKLVIYGKLDETEKFLLDRVLPDNVERVMIEGNGIWRLERYIFLPFLTQQYSGFLPGEYLEFFRTRILPDRPRTKNRRIIISRRCASKRHIINEEELADELSKLNFESVVLENLTVKEQIELFYDAEMVVGMHGAGFSNIIYSDRIEVLEIFPRNRMKPSYYYLSKALDHNYTYYCASDETGAINSDCRINTKHVVDLVNNMLGE